MPSSPQDGLPFPIPDDLLKYACAVASDKDIEEKATEKICALIKEKFPGATFEPDCKTVLEKGWEFLEAYCPKGRLTMPSSPQDGLPFPIPDDLLKYACAVASDKDIEEKATEKICALIKEKFPGATFEPDCKTVLEKGWEFLEAYCPKGRLSMPSPEEIEKRVCEYAKQRMLEELATEEVCDYMKKNFPSVHFQPDCRTELKKVWDTVKALCPKDSSSMSFPPEVEKAVCEVIEMPVVERRVVETVCTGAHAALHVPDAVCKDVLQFAWSKAEKLCPSQAADAVVV
mmetsp:Transcript_13683/g.42762  ORF Transcript_13683/g.42762 Transcript_13683/m.42762 type:complete len:287 (-) Transcript_13683:346-1206(-)